MKTLGLEISDVGVIVCQDGNPTPVVLDKGHSESPGFALQLNKKELLLGQAALLQAQVFPRRTNNRFWALLNTIPPSSKSAIPLSHAELVYEHLRQVSQLAGGQHATWVLAIPRFLDEQKLSILLGIASEMNMNVAGLVNQAVAAVTPPSDSSPIIHIDLHLHSTELSLITQDNHFVLEQSHVISEEGWDKLHASLSNHIRDAFVEATRFDPLHEAQTEQELYDQIPFLLRQGTSDRGVPLELKSGKRPQSISVTPQLLQAASNGICDKIASGVRELSNRPTHIQLSHRAELVPGLLNRLHQVPNLSITALGEGQAATTASQLSEEFGNQAPAIGAAYLSKRKRSQTGLPPNPSSPLAPPLPPPLPATQASAPIPLQPTHAILENKAVTLDQINKLLGGDGAIEVSNGQITQADPSLLLDGQPITTPTVLQLGQTIQFSNSPQLITLIHVEI